MTIVDDDLRRQLTDVVDRLRNRYYGKFRGTVTEVDETTLQIRAKVPAVFGDVDSGWCLPCVPYAGPGVGMVFLPEVGSGVWIEFEAGDPSLGLWVGCYWRSGELPTGLGPAVKGIVTVNGLRITLDDDTEELIISDASGNTVQLDSDGVTVARDGKKIVLSDGGLDVGDGAFEVS